MLEDSNRHWQFIGEGALHTRTVQPNVDVDRTKEPEVATVPLASVETHRR